MVGVAGEGWEGVVGTGEGDGVENALITSEVPEAHWRLVVC